MSRAPKQQPKTWAVVRAEYETAKAAELAAWERDADTIGAPRPPELDLYIAAYNALMACPAPDVAALAFKIANHHDTPDFDDFDATLPHAEEWRSIYNDALALAAPAPTHPDIEAEFAAVEALAERANATTDQAVHSEWIARDEAVLGRVEALPNAPENALIKALAVAHIYSDRSGGGFAEDATTDVRLAAQVVQCLLGRPL